MSLPGIGGTLFPSRFLADGLPRVCRNAPIAADDLPAFRHLNGWWQRVDSSCGPATSLRAIFDVAAMPLAALLGFRAHDAIFLQHRASLRLETRRGTPVGFVVLPWAARPSRLWRDLAVDARALGADWCLLFAPPFLSIVDARGCGVRRAVEFVMPDALDARSFPAFWTLCRASTFDRGGHESGGQLAPLDVLVSEATQFQAAVRTDLQSGVVSSLAALGPVLGQGHRDSADRFVEALTIVYRMLFLLFAESRDLLPRYPESYKHAYAIGQLCRATAHDDEERAVPGLWDALAAITRLSRAGCETADLIVRPFNGRLFARAAAPSLEMRDSTRRPTPRSDGRDKAVAAALVALGTRLGNAGREAITYADLGVEQLGAVYERVLDLDPDVVNRPPAPDRGAARARRTHSQRRKETGTFYTPQPLADLVVRRTLAPLVRGAGTRDLLALRVVDPAMGSGAFLVAACRYLAHAYEAALVDEGSCAETDLDEDARAGIRRLVASRCLAGVDANPIAVQLARLSLWLTSLARNRPLSFLDDRLRIGDSLIGAGPDDLWRTRRRSRRDGITPAAPLFDASGLTFTLGSVVRPLRQLREGPDDSIHAIRAQERIWSELNADSSPLAPWRRACDLWCARWFLDQGEREPSPQELSATFDAILRGGRGASHQRMGAWIGRARAIGRQRGFFHWPIEYADVFYGADGSPRDRPGFDAVIGNPPWEMVGRSAAETIAFIRESGHYPSCDRGHMNLYQPFLDRALSLARPGGRVGLLVPWGLAVDHGAAALRARLFERGHLDTIVGLDNAEGLFPIHRGLRFAVVVATPAESGVVSVRDTRARFGVRSAEDVEDLPGADVPDDQHALPIRLTPERIRRISGSALRIPDARDERDVAWLETLATRFPRLADPAGWCATFGRELNATDNRSSFGDAGLPVIGGKHISPFRTAIASTGARIDPIEARRLLPDGRYLRPRLAYRDVSAASNRFALIAAIVPANVVTTHTLFCLRQPPSVRAQYFLCGVFNSDLMNRFVRMLMGGHVTTDLIESLPIPRWDGSREHRRMAALARRLSRGHDERALSELNSRVDRMYGV